MMSNISNEDYINQKLSTLYDHLVRSVLIEKPNDLVNLILIGLNSLLIC